MRSFFLGLCFAVSTLAPSAPFAEVQNDRDIFEKVEVCEAYLAFLAGTTELDASDCHPLAQFQIENYNLSRSQFLELAIQTAGRQNTYGALALSVKSALQGDPKNRYTATEAASRVLSMRLAPSADLERVVLYSHLLSEIQRRAVLAMCRKNAECDTLPALTSIYDIVGIDFVGLNSAPPRTMLYCLLKTDGFLLPVRDVLASSLFNECLSAQKT